MNTNDQNNESRKNTGLWQMDCLSICVFLACGIDRQELAILMDCSTGCCHKHKMPTPARILQLAHWACHNETALSKELSRMLDDRFSKENSIVDRPDWREHVQNALQDSSRPQADIVGYAWTLLNSSDQQRHNFGCYMIHDIFIRMSLSAANATDIALQDNIDQLSTHCKDLQGRLESKQQEIDNMLAYIHKTRGHIMQNT